MEVEKAYAKRMGLGVRDVKKSGVRASIWEMVTVKENAPLAVF